MGEDISIFIIGAIFGALLAATVLVFIDKSDNLIKACESNLSRNESCKIIAVKE